MGTVSNMVTLERGLRAEFSKALQITLDPVVSSLYTTIRSTNSSEKYGWLQDTPIMQKFLDDKQQKGLLDYSLTVANTPYEATIKVDKFDLKDDNVGAAFARVKDLATRAKTYPIKLAMDALINGDATTGDAGAAYDGTAFFDTTRTIGDSGTIDNIDAGTGSTVAQITADFRNAREKMHTFKDTAGEPWAEGAGMDLIVACPSGLHGQFEELQGATIISNTTNVLKGVFRLYVSSRLAADDANDWYMLNVAGGIGPLILQERDPITFMAMEGDSDLGKSSRFYQYSVEWRGAMAYGHPQTAHKTTNS
jgi:phage major head subunit gpT-like protein